MNQKRIIRFDYGYTKTAEPADQCSRDPEFTALFQRAAQITAHKKDQTSSAEAQKCVQGAFDTEALYEAAKELGYLSGSNPLKNPQRFADTFDEFAQYIAGPIDSKVEEYALALFQKELMLSKHISQVEAFLNDRSFSPDNLTAEQWDSFDEAFFFTALDDIPANISGSIITPTVTSAFKTFVHRYTQQQEDFFQRLPFEKLANPDMLARVMQRAEKLERNFEHFLSEHLENPKFEKLIAAYLKFFPDRVSANFLVSVLEHIRQTPERTLELQEIILGKPGEEPPALLHTVLAKVRKDFSSSVIKNDEEPGKIKTALKNYAELIYQSCLIGHPDGLQAFESILQSKDTFIFRPFYYSSGKNANSYCYTSEILAPFLQTVAAGDIPNGVREDLQENFRDFSSRMRVNFPTHYREANEPAVIFLAELIAADKQESMASFEAAYKANQLAQEKEYHPPSYDNFATLLSNDRYDEFDRATLFAAMKILMKGDETDKMLTQFGKAINAGSQASPEVVEIYMKELQYRFDSGSEDAKTVLIKNRIADFLEKELNPTQYIRWAKILNDKTAPAGHITTFLDFTNHMGKIETFLTAEKAQARKPSGYTQLYVAYAQMLEQYGKTAGLDEVAYQPSATLGKLDRAGLYIAQQQLAPLALLKKHSLATQEKYAKRFFDSLKLNLDWFHDDEFNTSYPQLAQLPTRQQEYLQSVKEIAEIYNHNTIQAAGELVQAALKKESTYNSEFSKICRGLDLRALKETVVKTKDGMEQFTGLEILSNIALLGHSKAISIIFELWMYENLGGNPHAELMRLLRNTDETNPYLANIKAQILSGAETFLKHPGKHKDAFQLINFAAALNVEGSFEILERIALQDSADSDAALKKLFTRHEGETPQELEQVRQRFLDDWRNRLESDNVDEQELQKLRDLAGDDNTIIMNELSGSLNDYDQRQIEKQRAAELEKQKEAERKNNPPPASAPVAFASAPPPSPEPEKNLTELYEIIVNENQSELERAQALNALASQISTEADALPMLSALLWDIPDETFVDQVLEKFLVFSDQPAVAQELALLIEDCEQGRKDSERCEYILSYLSEL